MKDITVLILTKNEENNIRKCILSFKGLAKRFVIVDSYSADNTKIVCEELGEQLLESGITVDFYENEFVDHATQFNWGLRNTGITTRWTMRMDADEELLPELVDEIDKKIDLLSEDVSGIVLKRRVIFMGRWIKHGGVYPTYLLRIFKTGMATCEQRTMDEHILLNEGRSVIFENDLIDKNTKDITWWTEKHNWYSGREVYDYMGGMEGTLDKGLENGVTSAKQAQIRRKMKNNLYYKMPMFIRCRLYFLFRYYMRLGFLDGKEGRIFHFLQGYWYRFLVDVKIYEQSRKD